MRKTIRCCCLFVCTTIFYISAYTQTIKRVEPLNWWVGMHNPNLQIMLYGDALAQYTPQIQHQSMRLIQTNRVENANYLFLDVFIPYDAKAALVPIDFLDKKGKRVFSISYTLQNRMHDSHIHQGITNQDLIYLIMPDRFSNGDVSNDKRSHMREQTLNRDSMYDRHGGDLQGIINHFDYLKDLGVTALWNTPEVENNMKEASYHGYAVTDHYRIDPRYGSNELYQQYVAKAHQKGFKIIKDIVHNHIGSFHWMMADLPMKDWLHQWDEFTQTSFRDQTLMDPYVSQKDKDKMLNGWFVSVMPDLNQKNSFVQNYLTQNHIWWIEYAGIDGLRLDTYPYNDPEYMADWAQKILAEYPKLSIFGECLVWSVANQAFFAGGNTVNRGFDTHLPGVTDAVLKDAIAEALNGKDTWTDGFNRLYAVLAQDFLYAHPENNVIFLDNHDMSRFLSVIGEDKQKLKAGLALLLTLRGIPQLYYGTEIMMKNFSNPDGLVRKDFQGGWRGDTSDKFTAKGRTIDENEVFDWTKKLANYRKNTTALQSGKMMQFIPENNTYVYFRYNDEKTVMVAISKNDTETSLKTVRFAEMIKTHRMAKDIFTDQRIDISNTISIPPHGTIVLELQ